jgi:PAS domain S-box-containing protein
VVALEVSTITTLQRDLTLTIALGMLAVSLLGSLSGFLLARGISRPLNRLRRAAVALRKGDLDTPISVNSRLPEVAQVARALEDARVSLLNNILELRREKEWVEHLLESIVEGIVTLDRHGRITFFSQGAERISGWKQSQVLRRSVDEVFRPAVSSQTFSQLLPQPGKRQRITLSLPDGRLATLAISGAKLAPPEAGRARVALVLRDVSDEEAVHRLLGDFMANISHEFRTPLSALAASIELLLDQLPDLSQAELEELLISLHLGILGLQTLIDNLLEAASIESGQFRVFPRPADLAGIATEAGRTMQPLLKKNNLRLALALLQGLPPVQVDPRRTAQVLVNLLSNAIKYSPAGGEITLTVSTVGDFLRVSVADQGRGVAPEHRPDLFRRFAHIDTGSDRAEYGAGLGLSVVKAIVEAQGGQVGVMDRPGGGAVFWFTLPAVQQLAAPEEATP